MFRNMLNKLKNKNQWNIKSGCMNVGTLKKEGKLHYLYFDDRPVFSMEELDEILNICYKKANKKRSNR